MNSCCADCGEEGGAVSLKACTSCKLVKYCNAKCQRNHWLKHKRDCKRRAAELRDEALFKDPPAKEDCPICFLPLPHKLLACISLPPATIESVPIYDFEIANEGSAKIDMEGYFQCCGKGICRGCIQSFSKFGNNDQCPYCKADRREKTEEEVIEEMMKRVEVNDPVTICFLANAYQFGRPGISRDEEKAMELYGRAAKLGSNEAHFQLGLYYNQRGELKKVKLHWEAAAMAGHEAARHNVGTIESNSGNMERAVKHWMISASAGEYHSMQVLIILFEQGVVSRDSIDSTLTSYNNSCAELRSEARDSALRILIRR